jgi:hypothetical protein
MHGGAGEEKARTWTNSKGTFHPAWRPHDLYVMRSEVLNCRLIRANERDRSSLTNVRGRVSPRQPTIPAYYTCLAYLCTYVGLRVVVYA